MKTLAVQAGVRFVAEQFFQASGSHQSNVPPPEVLFIQIIQEINRLSLHILSLTYFAKSFKPETSNKNS